MYPTEEYELAFKERALEICDKAHETDNVEHERYESVVFS